MQHNEAVTYAHKMEPDIRVPALMRPKSWLIVMCDKEGKPHFYDCKDGPVKAITRLADNERTRDNELLEIMPFVDPESAAAQKINIIQVLKLVDYCLAKRTAPTSQREPAQGQP